jgi:prophage DNA circulation protein
MSTPSDFAEAVQTLAASLLAATIDPADSIRLLTALADFTPASTTPQSQQGAAMAAIQSATGDLCRRTAVIALARAATNYQPSSYDDAAAIRNRVCDLLDNEITIAGDQGEDTTYSALRALRFAVVQDLTARGANLAPIKTFAIGAPMPALVLANRFYRDASRGDELVTHADPIHPAFMPTTFQALAD